MGPIAALVFAISGLLLLVAFLPPLARQLRLPDSVLLAALGCALGLAVSLIQNGSPHVVPRLLDDLARGLADIELSSELFLSVFLPLLLFETALRVDARATLRDAGPILVMAVVAVVVTTLVAGTAIWAVSALPLAGGLLVAAIIATTDPVAVVAVFREVGAPRRLMALVEGESLLNDAAAIALFAALVQLLARELAPDIGQLALGFGWDFLGGMAAGALLGWLASLALSRLDAGGPAEITLGLALAYLTYVTAETYFHVSGVVAVVLAGLVYGDAARVRLSAESLHALHSIWTQIAFWASSLIFVLAATLVPAILEEASLVDLGLLLVLLAGALAARALVLYGVLPLVSRGEARRVRGDHKLVMLWGGLRGAVTLALALGVREDLALPEGVRHAVAVLATGFVLFTLLVQATTLRPLIHYLGLDRLTPLERMLRERAVEASRADIRGRLTELAASLGLPVKRAAETRSEKSAGEEITRQQLASALITITRHEIELLVDQVARGVVSRRSAARSIGEARAMLDALRVEGISGYRRLARLQLQWDPLTRLSALAQRRLGIERPLARRLADRSAQLLVRRAVLNEVCRFVGERIEQLFGPRIAETALSIVRGRQNDAERALDALRLQYPDYWRALSRRYLDRTALRLERDSIEQMSQQGLLTPEVERELLADIRRRYAAIGPVPRLDLGLDVLRLLGDMPLFSNLDAGTLRELAAMLYPRLALPDERLVRRGDNGDEMYFIASGAVEVVLGPGRVRLGTGDFVGELALITRQPRAADVVALGYSQLLALRREDFQRFLRSHPEMMETVRRIASERAGRNLELQA
jgi:CPA1 family monovalent cation:H+ antiporter